MINDPQSKRKFFFSRLAPSLFIRNCITFLLWEFYCRDLYE